MSHAIFASRLSLPLLPRRFSTTTFVTGSEQFLELSRSKFFIDNSLFLKEWNDAGSKVGRQSPCALGDLDSATASLDEILNPNDDSGVLDLSRSSSATAFQNLDIN